MKSQTYCQYMREVERTYRPLTAKEEQECFELVKKGNQEAYLKIYNSMLKYVVEMAQKYKNHGIDLEDLIQEGNLILATAIRKFDLSKNLRFITYAKPWIKSAMLEKISELGHFASITGPENLKKFKYLNAVKKLQQKLQREPTVDEICEEAHLSEEDAERINMLNSCGSFDVKIGPNKEDSLLDITPDTKTFEDTYEIKELKKKIKEFLKESSLDNKEKNIIKLYHGLGGEHKYTFQEIADRLNRTKQGIEQIYSKSLKILVKINNTKKQMEEFHLTPSMI